MAIDKSGNIWVADQGNVRVEKFNSSGSYLLSIGAGYQGAGGSVGGHGTGNGQFGANSIYGVAVDASGNVSL